MNQLLWGLVMDKVRGEGLDLSGVSGYETICVVGLGYVGLPTAIAFHSAGFNVIGVDVSDKVISGLREGKSPLVDSSSKIEIPVYSKKWILSIFENPMADGFLSQCHPC